MQLGNVVIGDENIRLDIGEDCFMNPCLFLNIHVQDRVPMYAYGSEFGGLWPKLESDISGLVSVGLPAFGRFESQSLGLTALILGFEAWRMAARDLCVLGPWSAAP